MAGVSELMLEAAHIIRRLADYPYQEPKTIIRAIELAEELEKKARG